MKEYYVTWINEDQDQIEGRKPHNEIRDDGELTGAETADEAVEDVRQWISERASDQWYAGLMGYDRIEIDEDNGDIIVWGIIGDNRKFINAYVDFRARLADEEETE